MLNVASSPIAIIGLGYVGLPLAVEFGRKRKVIGFDVNSERISQLRAGNDRTLEISSENLHAAVNLRYSENPDDLCECFIFIVTVPTPVDPANRPDLTPLLKASEMIGRVLRSGAIVIYESTVFPGATEEVCVPVLEKHSGKKFNVDFYCGYSPERINPGDKKNTLTKIKKVTSGSTPEVAEVVDALYREIISAGTYKATSLKVAEAAKVIENTQRDLNIALMNELSLIFHKLNIDTLDVLAAAGTKWNFLPFRPGLVGGHCIGVDPYYLTHKAQEVGYHPEVILAGRRVNNNIVNHVADETIKLMLRKGHGVLGGRILVLGLTFKENCPDVRNTKVADLVRLLQDYHATVDVYDPWVESAEALHEYGIQCLNKFPDKGIYSAIVVAVAHQQFVELGAEGVRAFGVPNAVIYDVKGLLPFDAVDGRL